MKSKMNLADLSNFHLIFSCFIFIKRDYLKSANIFGRLVFKLVDRESNALTVTSLFCM